MNLLTSIEGSALGTWIRESEWGYPIVLICHTLGMALLAGVALAAALRITLTGAKGSLAGFGALLRFAWLGFAISLVSGAILFAGAAQRFSAHPAFQIKLAAVTAAGVSLLIAARSPSLAVRAAPAARVHPSVRWLSGVSILLWVAAIAAGRLMAYIR